MVQVKVSAPEKRALSLLREAVRKPAGTVFRIDQICNPKKTILYLQKHIVQYPALYLGRTILCARGYRWKAAIRAVIERNRRPCVLWTYYTRRLMIRHLKQQFQVEYDLGLRPGPSMASAKADAAIWETFPTIARFPYEK